MNLAEAEMRGWAWNCGVCILPLLYLLLEPKSKLAEEYQKQPVIIRKIMTNNLNKRDTATYDTIKKILEEIALEARLFVKLPKTLSALKRQPNPFRQIERDLYREFLNYGISVSEVMLFAFKIGIFGLVKDKQKFDETEKPELLDSWKKAALRAEEEFKQYQGLFKKFLTDECSPDEFVKEASDIFYQKNPGSKNLWQRLVNATTLSPNFQGIGIDLKKLMDD